MIGGVTFDNPALFWNGKVFVTQYIIRWNSRIDWFIYHFSQLPQSKMEPTKSFRGRGLTFGQKFYKKSEKNKIFLKLDGSKKFVRL